MRVNHVFAIATDIDSARRCRDCGPHQKIRIWGIGILAHLQRGGPQLVHDRTPVHTRVISHREHGEINP